MNSSTKTQTMLHNPPTATILEAMSENENRDYRRIVLRWRRHMQVLQTKETKEWWIEGVPDRYDEVEQAMVLRQCGPYDTKAGAEDDRDGMARCLADMEWEELHGSED